MIYVLMVIAGVMAGAGLVLIADYVLCRFTSAFLDLEVSGFQDKKFLGRALPLVKRADEAGNIQTIKVDMIDHIGYLVSPPILRQSVSVALMKNGRARIYGYLRLSAGLLALFPFLIVLGLKFGREAMMGQVVYVGLFCAIAVGGWIVLRLVGRNP